MIKTLKNLNAGDVCTVMNCTEPVVILKRNGTNLYTYKITSGMWKGCILENAPRNQLKQVADTCQPPVGMVWNR